MIYDYDQRLFTFPTMVHAQQDSDQEKGHLTVSIQRFFAVF